MFNNVIVSGILAWLAAQIIKTVLHAVKNDKVALERLVGSGGMPSSHSAVVTSLATLVGKEYGVNSAMFAITLIFAFVVMYDACGVRRAAGKQAKVLNDIVNTPGRSNLQVREKLQEALGHTPAQGFVGALIGIVAGIIL